MSHNSIEWNSIYPMNGQKKCAYYKPVIKTMEKVISRLTLCGGRIVIKTNRRYTETLKIKVFRLEETNHVFRK